MNRKFSLLLSVCLVSTIGAAKPDQPVTVSNAGWSVSLDEARSIMSISHETLGALLTDVRLNLRNERGLRPLANWSVEKLADWSPHEKRPTQISIRTTKPATTWLIELRPNLLKISSTSTDAVLTANAPSPTDRIVARLLDPQGAPVDWTGSSEIYSYEGGRETRNPSFLPSRNPEVMYFALGQVSSLNLHSLFDRKTDAAISFSDQTVMQRSQENSEMLELTIPVPGNTVIRLMPDYYTKTLGLPHYVPFDDSHFRTAPTAWNSWDNYYSDVTEADIVRNTDWIAAHLKPYGFEYVVLDGTYNADPSAGLGDKQWHNWTEEWDQTKFPHGPKWLADYIKSKGLHPGVWLVPNSYAGAVEQHPDWYLYYKGAHKYWGKEQKDGSMVQDYVVPALDETNPEVLDLLKKEFTTLDELGFEWYMFDGEHDLLKYTPGVDLDRIHDKSIDPTVAYRNRLKAIRDTIGPDRFIEACPNGAPEEGIGYIDAFYNGTDMYPSWHGNYMMLSSLNANAFLNHIVVYTMTGEGIEVGLPMSLEEAMRKRPPEVVNQGRDHEGPLLAGFGVSLPEARTLVTYTALTGVVYGLSSVTPELPEERVKLLQMSLPTLPILPIDLFSRGTDLELWNLFKHETPDTYIHDYPEILDLKVNAPSGVYDVVGMTNWRGETATRDLSFADKLGLQAGASYIAFDAWNQKLAGVFKDRMKVDIEPHDTRVFLIHPWMPRPQLVGTSRHITGAYSIKEITWDGTQKRLYGASDTVPGDDYTLWFYVPDGFTVAKARASLPRGGQIAVHQEVTGNSLAVSFPGQQEAVNWEVQFSEKLGK